MSDTPRMDVVRALEDLIASEHLENKHHEPSLVAQHQLILAANQLILAAKLLETAGFELAQTEGVQHTLTLLALSELTIQISKTI